MQPLGNELTSWLVNSILFFQFGKRTSCGALVLCSLYSIDVCLLPPLAFELPSRWGEAWSVFRYSAGCTLKHPLSNLHSKHVSSLCYLENHCVCWDALGQMIFQAQLVAWKTNISPRLQMLTKTRQTKFPGSMFWHFSHSELDILQPRQSFNFSSTPICHNLDCICPFTCWVDAGPYSQGPRQKVSTFPGSSFMERVQLFRKLLRPMEQPLSSWLWSQFVSGRMYTWTSISWTAGVLVASGKLFIYLKIGQGLVIWLTIKIKEQWCWI